MGKNTCELMGHSLSLIPDFVCIVFNLPLITTSDTVFLYVYN